MNGIINVYKEQGFTSFDVVAKLRGILKTKKIGHTGTLDPEAVGVLPVCIGNATKVCDLLTDKTKEYVAHLRLGIVTDTQDMTGTVLENHEAELAGISDEQIRETILGFVGEIEQIPPMYSAIKIDGQKLYDLARKGIEVERKARRITIKEIEILDEYDGLHNIKTTATDSKNPNDDAENGLHKVVIIRVVCSKGTYIRTLCHDIGRKLGCGGCMEHLERTRVGNFTVEDAYTLSEIEALKEENGLHNIVMSVDSVFKEYPELHVTPEGMKALNNGNQLQTNIIRELTDNPEVKLKGRQVYRMYSYDNQFYGVFEYHSGWNVLKPVKMFLPTE